MYLSENLKALRKQRDWTQEDVADALGLSAQSVSKWERGDNLPDITLLPTLANLFKTSVDALIGMERINNDAARRAVFITELSQKRAGEYAASIKTLESALKTYPTDTGMSSEFAMSLALHGGEDALRRAARLCERVLADGASLEKTRYTTQGVDK
jgi:transcriptional regulator with XRE-family HTH domain